MKIALALVLYIPTGALRGWAVLMLWGWYAVPLGAPVIGLAQAWGVSWLVSLLTWQQMPRDEDADPIYGVVLSATISLLAVGIGWIVSLAL